MTKGETYIAQILTKAHITFTTEKSFTDLRGGRFRFDFYLPKKNILIEYQGEQHYQFIPRFYKTPLDFERAQGRDMRKISYALAHNIPLYLIPYWELDKIITINELLSDTYLARDRYANKDAYDKFKHLTSK